MSGASAALPYFTAADITRLLPIPDAIAALRAALRDDVDPERDAPRLFSEFPGGEFLLMPAQGTRFSGLKALTVAPENPARGLAKIQGVYIVYSSDTAEPLAILEGASLTAIRTPAVALLAVQHLVAIAPPGGEPAPHPRILVFGAGVQAAAHIRAAATAFPDATFDVVGRRPARVDVMIEALSGAGETRGVSIRNRTGSAEAAVPEADIILCTTSTSTPLFDGALVAEHAVVAANGTHGTDKRELDDALIERSDLVVEGRASAQRENGNLTALDAEVWGSASAPANLRDLVTGDMRRTPGRPAVFTGVGMAWEDLICASAVLESAARRDAAPPRAEGAS